MALHHNRKPVYRRASSPGNPNVTDLASYVYQWKESGARPADVVPGNAWMPPFENSNDIVVWSDSNTLGYGFIPNAPMFWSDGGLGEAKILQIINHVANRKSNLTFSNINDAKTWILAQTDIYTNLTAALEYILGPGGNQTLTIVNNTTRPLVRIQIRQTTADSLIYPTNTFHAEGHADPNSGLAAWLPIQPGSSVKLYGILATTNHFGPAVGTTTKIGISVYWDQSETKTLDTLVNGIAGIPSNVTSTSFGTSFSAARDGSSAAEISLQPGDDVVVNFTSVSATPTYPVGTGNYSLKFTNNTSETINKIDVGNIDGSQATFVATGVTPIPMNGGQVAWLPLAPGESVELTGVDGFLGGGGSGTGTTAQIGLGTYWLSSATRYGYVKVNGVAGNPYGFAAGTTTNYFNAARAGYLSLQAGDAVEVLFTNSPI